MPQWVRSGEKHPRRSLVLRTQLPFAVGVLIAAGASVITFPTSRQEPQMVLGVIVMLITVAVAVLAPWERWPPLWRLILSGLNLATVGLLQSGGDTLNATYLLAMFPLLWMAFSFGALGAAGALFGAVGVIWLPGLLYGDYPEDGRAWSELIVLTSLIAAIIVIVAAQASRFRKAHMALQDSTADREHAIEERERALAEADRVGLILGSVADEVNVALVFLDEAHQVILDNKVSRELATRGGFDRSTGALVHAYVDSGMVALPSREQPVLRVTSGETIRDFLYWVGPPGHQRAILNNGRPVVDDQGRYRGAVLVGHDVTDLLDAIRVREESLANLSHELRTPLTSLIGHLELFEDSDLPAASRRPLQAMSRGADQLLDLATRFLAASSPTPTPQISNVNLNTLVGQAINQLPHHRETPVPIFINVPVEVEVEADPTMLQSIIDILLRNAIAYTDVGQITLSADRVDGVVEIAVSDTGIGIPATDLTRVYDRFHRGANVIAREIRGVGLGLGVARSMVLANGGLIEIESVEGSGTRVRVTVPAKTAPLYPDDSPDQTTSTNLSDLR